MRFFRRKKGKTPKSSPSVYVDSGSYPTHGFAQPESSAAYSPRPCPPPTRASAAILAQLPTSILERIFAFVCPHTQDESYETCEESAKDNACMLCDLRDIASCGKTCKRWRESARKLMYHSIRIDSVHYCEREHILAERRKRNFLDRNADPEDTALKRLQLLARSVREAPTHLGHLVQFLKTPYMLRQSAQADLARAINVMPYLRYVDLPDGFFTGDPVYHILRTEVEACCRNLRRMKFQAGSELTLAKLAGGTTWPVLETVELDRVNIDPVTLRHVLGVLPKLRALKVTECPAFTDDLFWEYDGVAPFPPLAEFILSKTPNVTAAGLTEWLRQGHARNVLKVLTLTATGVKTWTLHQIVANAFALTHLSLIDVVDTAFPAANAGNAYDSLALPLSSRSLQSLHYEITPSAAAGPFGATATASHYTYLSQSLLGGGLPGLKQLYVRDPTFPDTLLGLPPPMPAFAGEAGSFRPRSGSAGMLPSPKSGSLLPPSGNAGINRPTSLTPHSMNHTGGAGAGTRLSSNNPFGRQLAANIPPLLEVFTKGDEDLDWSLLQMGPGGYGGDGQGSHSRTGSTGRPMSGYGLGADIMGGASGWGAGQSRRSVMVGDGAGGFLAVPGDEQGRTGHRKTGSTVSSSAGKGPWGIGSDDEGEDLWPGSRPKSSTGEKRRDLWR